MEEIIKKIDEKLAEIELAKQKMSEVGLIPNEYDELDAYLLGLGYTEEDIDLMIEMDLQEEALEMGAPMGNQNAAGPHVSGGKGKWSGKRGQIRRAQYKKDMASWGGGKKHNTKDWSNSRKKYRDFKKSLHTPEGKAEGKRNDKKMETFKKQLNKK